MLLQSGLFCLTISKFWSQFRLVVCATRWLMLDIICCSVCSEELLGLLLIWLLTDVWYDMKIQIHSGSLSSVLPNQLNPLIVPVQSRTRHLHLLIGCSANVKSKTSFPVFIPSSIAYDDLAQLTSTLVLYLCICAMIQRSAVPWGLYLSPPHCHHQRLQSLLIEIKNQTLSHQALSFTTKTKSIK